MRFSCMFVFFFAACRGTRTATLAFPDRGCNYRCFCSAFAVHLLGEPGQAALIFFEVEVFFQALSVLLRSVGQNSSCSIFPRGFSLGRAPWYWWTCFVFFDRPVFLFRSPPCPARAPLPVFSPVPLEKKNCLFPTFSFVFEIRVASPLLFLPFPGRWPSEIPRNFFFLFCTIFPATPHTGPWVPPCMRFSETLPSLSRSPVTPKFHTSPPPFHLLFFSTLLVFQSSCAGSLSWTIYYTPCLPFLRRRFFIRERPDSFPPPIGQFFSLRRGESF